MQCLAFLPGSQHIHRHTLLGLHSTGENVQCVCVCVCVCAHTCLCAPVVCVASSTCEGMHPCSGGSGYLSSAQVINWWVIKQLAPELSKIMNEGPVDVNI